MGRKVVINPQYEYLRNYIEAIPENFDELGVILEAKRNVLRKDRIEGLDIVIKSFRRIYLLNRIRYSFFYPSKAERAFDHANKVIQKGFNTPAPVAYIEIKRYGLITQSYFISEYLDYQQLYSIVQPHSDQVSEWAPDFIQYTYQLHQSNIYHVDYNLGNIIFRKQNNRYEFALVDINRMRFGTVSLRKGIMNLARLDLSLVDDLVLARGYTNLRKKNAIMGIELMFHYKVIGNRKHRLKAVFKKMIKGLRFFFGIISFSYGMELEGVFAFLA